MINRYIAGKNNKIRGIKNTYLSEGHKNIKISNNVKTINVISTLQQKDIDRNSLTSIDFGNNVVALDENCLFGCSNLQYVGGTGINKVGDKAFCDCTSLTSIEFFNKGTKTNLSEIGERAFSNTGLVNVYMKPDQNANTKIEPYAFADCQNLKYVETIQFNTFGEYQFQNCTALETVKMANSHGYMGKYVFQNCSRIKNITIPAVTWGLGEGMFCDCSSLTSIEFNEPSELNLRHCFGNFFLSGTSIESITFPKSVTKLDCFDNWSLYGMNNLKEIHFNGIPMNKLVNTEETGTPTDIPLNIWSIASDIKQQFILTNYEKSYMTGEEFERFAKMNNVAVFTFYSTKSTSSKSKNRCSEMGKYFSMDSFKVWMNNLQKPIAFLEKNVGSGCPYYTFSYYSISSGQYLVSQKIEGDYQFSDLTQEQREQTLKTIIFEKIEPNIKEYIEQTENPPQINYEEKYPFNTIIGSLESHLNGAIIPTMYYNINNQIDRDFFGNIFLYARTRHVPVISFVTGSDCEICHNFFNNCIKKQEFKDYIDSLGEKKILIVDSCRLNEIQSPLFNHNRNIYLEHGLDGSYVIMIGEYLDSNSQIHTNAVHVGSSTTIEQLKQIINNWLTNDFSGYEHPLDASFQMQILNSDIQSSSCFGVNHDVKLFSNDGKSIDFKLLGENQPPTFIYEQMQVVDMRTVDNFKYGQWYGNARELKQFADANHIPVMIEIGSEGCPPCQAFNASVFQDNNFQTYIQNNVPILLGKVEGVSGNTNSQFVYAYNSWCNQSDSDFPTGAMPILLFYWNQLLDDSTVGESGTITNKKIENISKKYVKLQKGITDDAILTFDEIKKEIEDFITGYTRDSKFNKPEIDKFLDGYPRYMRYNNVEDDDYGRYLPVKNLKYQGSITLSVNNSSGVLTEYTINQGQTTELPPNGTYEYFTLPQETENYDIEYQREGVIFKVGKGGQDTIDELDKFSYGSKDATTYEQEQELSSITHTEIKNFSVYQDGSTDLNPGLDEDEIYNLVYTYLLSPSKKRGETDYYKIKLYLSAEVSYDQENDDYQIIGTPYVLTANWYYYANNEEAVQWLKGFDNMV